MNSMKNLAFICFFFLSQIVVHAQGGYQPKLNMQLSRMAANEQLRQNHINLLVQGDIAKIKTFAEEKGGFFRYAVGNIATIRIPVSAINDLASLNQVTRIENPMNNYTAMNDSMRSK